MVKKTKYNANIKYIEGKIPDITTLNAKVYAVKDKIPRFTNLATNAALKAKINEVKGKIPSITNLATTNAFTAVENKVSNVSNLVKVTYYNIKINKIQKKKRNTDHDHSNKYITTKGFNKLT